MTLKIKSRIYALLDVTKFYPLSAREKSEVKNWKPSDSVLFRTWCWFHRKFHNALSWFVNIFHLYKSHMLREHVVFYRFKSNRRISILNIRFFLYRYFIIILYTDLELVTLKTISNEGFSKDQIQFSLLMSSNPLHLQVIDHWACQYIFI
jgi:hypothetical protein